MLKRRTQTWLMPLLLLMFIFNNLSLAFAASQHLAQARAYSDDDKVLICTGRDMKWVSMSASWQAGTFVFVDAPKDLPQELKTLKCGDLFAQDLKTCGVSHAITIAQLSYPDLLNPRLATPHLQAQYAKALSRAPPAV
ncbi:hypothetical protein GCM10009092_07260 [Bowmanella denitrificans]|uniref:Uncharacterized protein n=1 Tax=Bowmanella denitrificans TaxID=366582 RepID=A0ABP3GHS2_9ALTE